MRSQVPQKTQRPMSIVFADALMAAWGQAAAQAATTSFVASVWMVGQPR
jgi:hypothetical protein